MAHNAGNGEDTEAGMSEDGKRGRRYRRGGDVGGIYFLGFIGAVIYFIGQADGFWRGVLGVLEAFIWPVLLVYHLLQFLHV